jgi:hypothetical protein
MMLMKRHLLSRLSSTGYERARQIVIGTYQGEISRLNLAVDNRDDVIRSQERHLQKVEALNQDLVLRLNQSTTAAKQPSTQDATIPLLKVKQQLATQIKERKDLEAGFQQALSRLQVSSAEKVALQAELANLKTDCAKAIHFHKLLSAAQVKVRCDQRKGLESQITSLNLQHAADLKEEREKRMRLESGMDSLSRDQLSVINDLQNKVDDQTEIIRSFELAIISLSGGDNVQFQGSAEPYATDTMELEFELAGETEDYLDKEATDWQDALAERDQLRLQMEKTGIEHAAAVLRLKTEHAEEMEEARKKQSVELQQVHQWRDKLLYKVDQMRRENDKSKVESQDQDCVIGGLHCQPEDAPSVITGWMYREELSEKIYETMAVLSGPASEEAKIKPMTSRDINQQPTQLPVRMPQFLPKPRSMASDSRPWLYIDPPLEDDQNHTILNSKLRLDPTLEQVIPVGITTDQAPSIATSTSAPPDAQLLPWTHSANSPLEMQHTPRKETASSGGHDVGLFIDRKRKWNRIYSPDEQGGPEQDDSMDG